MQAEQIGKLAVALLMIGVLLALGRTPTFCLVTTGPQAAFASTTVATNWQISGAASVALFPPAGTGHLSKRLIYWQLTAGFRG